MKFLRKPATKFLRNCVAKIPGNDRKKRKKKKKLREVEEDEEVGDNDDDSVGFRARLEVELARTPTGAEVFAVLKGAANEDEEAYKKQPSRNIKSGMIPDSIEDMYTKAHAVIGADSSAKAKLVCDLVKAIHYDTPEQTYANAEEHDEVKNEFLVTIPTTRKKKKTKMRIMMTIQKKAELAWMLSSPRTQGNL